MNRALSLGVALVAAGTVALVACSDDTSGAATSSRASSPSFCDAVEHIAALRAAPGIGLALDGSMTEREMGARVSDAQAELQAQVDDGMAALDALDATAPETLRGDVATITEADRRYLDAFAEDPFDVDAMFAVARESKRLADVEARIDVHSRAECGVTFRRFASGLETG